MPTVEAEDAKRPHREPEFLVLERVRIENRIAALSRHPGRSGEAALRSWMPDMRASENGWRPPAADPSRRRVEPLASALSLT